MYDFHTHTFLSDGELLPIELIRRAVAIGYRGIALTDHASASNLEQVIHAAIRDCDLANDHWDIRAIPGVELTHVPAVAISEMADRARETGAGVVVVHGETVVEPVEPGTNAAAVEADVDILAHPGPILETVARRAAERGVFLEITSRKGHSYSNGHVARVATKTGAPLLLNTDGHSPDDLITRERALEVLRGAGLTIEDSKRVLDQGPLDLLERIDGR